ncbi:MAG: hypothetical protein IJZ19_11710 [Lentisphaeria bacterium]|nr:hypothetical protein [Lentisphaeria bacterium]
MSNWKEKISLRNCSSANIAMLCWCGTIFAGNITVMACNKVNFETLPENCAASAVLFLIQLATAVILGDCYDKIKSSLHRKILIASGVLHGILMLWDMSLLLWLGSFWGCFILSIMLFLLTGIYLMFLRKRWQGIVVALFSLIAWIQPVFFFVVQQ